MAGTNGPTSAAGTKDTANPDAKPAGATGSAGSRSPGQGGVRVDTPTPKPAEGGGATDGGDRD